MNETVSSFINVNTTLLTTTTTITNLATGDKNQDDLFIRIVIAVMCSIVIFLALAGNTLVVTVIIRYKQLQNATNYILLGLAIADITVTFLVMIPATIQDVTHKWIFNQLYCKFYNAFDITCCTASILHLLLVAIDRYIAIFKPLKYRDLVRNRNVFTAVCVVWTVSLCLSFIPIFMGWNKTSSTGPVNEDECSIEANLPYAIISSSLSFWIPFIVMTLLYIKIYIVAKRQANAIAQLSMHRNFSQDTSISYTNAMNNYSNNTSNNNNNTTNTGGNVSNLASASTGNIISNSNKEILNEQQIIEINRFLDENGEPRSSDDRTATMGNNPNDKKSKITRLLRQLRSIEKKRTKDTKAIKTLGIIMGIFLMCWLPFFYMYLYCAVKEVSFDKLLERIITWVGYVNSFINPIVYALTSKDFRKSYFQTLKLVSNKFCPDKRPSLTGKESIHSHERNSRCNYINNNNGSIAYSDSTKFPTKLKSSRLSWLTFKKSNNKKLIVNSKLSKTSNTLNSTRTSRTIEEEFEMDTERKPMIDKDETTFTQNHLASNNNIILQKLQQSPRLDSQRQKSPSNSRNTMSKQDNNFFSEDVNTFVYIDYETINSELNISQRVSSKLELNNGETSLKPNSSVTSCIQLSKAQSQAQLSIQSGHKSANNTTPTTKTIVKRLGTFNSLKQKLKNRRVKFDSFIKNTNSNNTNDLISNNNHNNNSTTSTSNNNNNTNTNTNNIIMDDDNYCTVDEIDYQMEKTCSQPANKRDKRTTKKTFRYFSFKTKRMGELLSSSTNKKRNDSTNGNIILCRV